MSVEDTNVVDFVARDPTGDVVLVMVEGREWDGSDARLFELQQKINNYASFVCDGQLLENYPELRGKPVRVELRCVSLPDPKTADFLDIVRENLGQEGVSFSVRQIGAAPSG